MKINEIILEASYKKHLKNIQNELDHGLSGVLRVPSLLPKIWSDYESGIISPPEALHLFKTLKAIYEDLFYDDEVWKNLQQHDPSGITSKDIATQMANEEDMVGEYINSIKQKHGLNEDVTDFKASDGQLSAMGSKRKKTRRDSAKSEVEQLVRK